MGESTGGRVRGDVQGLRALAVVVVVLGHAEIGPFTGGFVGVDVFFVISGFLITSLLLREADRTGRVSLTAFYARRARRILPAATVVVVATLLASAVLASLLDTRALVVDAVWAATFAANIRFARTGTDYFAQDEAPSALQHYWSLAVEEQFYLVWPLLVLGCCVWAAARGRASAPSPRRRTASIATVLVVLALASMAWNLLRVPTDPTSAYFSSLTRGWELALGALCAVGMVRHDRHLRMRDSGAERAGLSGMAGAVLGWSGLAAVLTACVTFGSRMPFPGVAALLPTLGAAALLVAGALAPAAVPTRLLGVWPLRRIGDWSYSIYLIHWPVLILAAAAWGRDPTTLEAIGLVALTIVLSAVCYRWVEQPFRRPGRWRVPRTLLLYPASLLLVLATAGCGWWWTAAQVTEDGGVPAISAGSARLDGTAAEAIAVVRASVLASQRDEPAPSDLTPDLIAVADDVPDVGACEYGEGVRDLCPLGDTAADRTLVLIGDSHARMWIPAFERIAERYGFTLYALTLPSCPIATLTVGRPNTTEGWAGCDEFRDWAVETVGEVDADLVVATSAYPIHGVYDGDRYVGGGEALIPLWRDGWRDVLARLGEEADSVAVLGDVPKLPEAPSECLTARESSLRSCLQTPTDLGERMRAESRDAADEAGAAFIRTDDLVCWRGQCPAVIGDLIAYRDLTHLTSPYVTAIAGPLGGRLAPLMEP